eukprot:NODE_185_length_13590_cov_0.472908.p3 type:complete len:468 gc:universal NODE_185_length_13590_cov_0.472908:1406-2809(+)
MAVSIAQALTVLQIAVVIYFGYNSLNLKVFLSDNLIQNKITNKPIQFSIRQENKLFKKTVITRPMDPLILKLRVLVDKPLLICIEDACINTNIKVNETHFQKNFTYNIIDGDFDAGYTRQLRNNVPYPFHNQFYHLYQNMEKVKGDKVDVKIQIYDISFYKYTLFLHYAASFQELRSVLKEKDIDQFKNIFIDTNFYYLILTLSVSVLHTVLDFFAFKNDVLFWKDKKAKKDFTGLSVTTIGINIICQFVILLFLIDSGKTNTVIIVSSLANLAIETWKCSKLVSLDGFKFKIDQDEQTWHFDKMAFRWMSILLSPILIGYSIYCLMYNTYSSNYSLVITISASFVYGFQFATLTPQLFINYHMKSVSHLPWRMLTYKFLGTIVDDLFAFIIEMPFLHRLACFRDDIIFVIAIYQRYLYPVDKTRVNEYGQVFEKGEKTEDSAEKDSKKIGEVETSSKRDTLRKRVK